MIGLPLHAGIVESLASQWEYRKGFKKKWLTESEPGKWKKIKIPCKFSNLKEFIHYKGFITVRKKLSPEINQLLRSGYPVTLNAGMVSDVSFFYLNDTLIGQRGSVDPYRSGMYRFFIADLPLKHVREKRENFITISIFSNGIYPININSPEIEIGSSEQVYFNFYTREIVSFILLSMYFFVGVFSLLLSLKRPGDIQNLYFGIFSILISIFWFISSTAIRDSVFQDYVVLKLKLEYISMFLMGPMIVFFFTQFFNRKYTITGIVFGIICSLISVVAVFGSYVHIKLCFNYIWRFAIVYILIYIIFYTSREIYRKNRDALYLFIGFVILSIGALYDILVSAEIFQSMQISKYTFFLFILGIVWVLANRFVRAHNQFEELNINLEAKVVDRTKQLQNTLNEVEKLKVQQDGDYFLTSLLIEPLGGNFAESKIVNVEFVIEQKKKFHFKRWDVEIGGDLCADYSINLRGKDYTVFMNGDAMGKSIQGAGGAIVLGTVFKSIISRTELSDQARERYPEQWMKDCFFELQNVFIGFNGSMLVSIVIGLVDEKCGLLYFINAEHPRVVLYRNGNAVFIEEEPKLKKIGIEGWEDNFQVRTFHLKPHDVIFVGSDGKDDILYGTDDAGNRIINEDENKFLKMVEEGEGILSNIKERIQNDGELIDDIAITRISYKENYSVDEMILPEGFEKLLIEGKNAADAE